MSEISAIFSYLSRPTHPGSPNLKQKIHRQTKSCCGTVTNPVPIAIRKMHPIKISRTDIQAHIASIPQINQLSSFESASELNALIDDSVKTFRAKKQSFLFPLRLGKKLAVANIPGRFQRSHSFRSTSAILRNAKQDLRSNSPFLAIRPITLHS